MKVHVEPEDIVKRSTDDRGRIYLGSKYANKVVEAAVLNPEDDE